MPGTSLTAAFLTLLSTTAGAQHYDAGHSLEADQHDERVEGVQARAKGRAPGAGREKQGKLSDAASCCSAEFPRLPLPAPDL
jgi:hypothetical protein